MALNPTQKKVVKPRAAFPKPIDWQRHFIGVTAIVLGILALIAGYGLVLSDVGAIWAMGTFGKVSMVLALAWLAWPQLLLLKKMPGGGIAIASVLICIVVFIARPKLLLYVVPLLALITILFGAITWVQRNLLPPKN